MFDFFISSVSFVPNYLRLAFLERFAVTIRYVDLGFSSSGSLFF
jgi:hypothetical protein